MDLYSSFLNSMVMIADYTRPFRNRTLYLSRECSLGKTKSSIQCESWLYLQTPYGGLFLGDKFWVFPWGSDHLCPPNSLLQLHQPFLVLVSFHQHPGHLHTSEPLTLGHGHIILQYRRCTNEILGTLRKL